jgi:hypothetical protein
MLVHGQVKYLAAMWMSALARRHPGLCFTPKCPGNTTGTEPMRDLAAPLRVLVPRVLLSQVAPLFGVAHKLEDRIARLVDAVANSGLPSAVFYSHAANTITSPVCDQAEIMPEFRDPAVQDNAAKAIHR